MDFFFLLPFVPLSCYALPSLAYYSYYSRFSPIFQFVYNSFSVQCYSPLNFSTIISIRVGKSRERVESLESCTLFEHTSGCFFTRKLRKPMLKCREIKMQLPSAYSSVVFSRTRNSRIRQYHTGNLIFVAASSLSLERTAG